MSGVIAGRGRGIDLFGACFLGLITAFGGGTVRDVILDVPVAWTRNSPLLVFAFAVALVTFFAAKRQEHAPWMQSRIFWWADACALALFSVLGCAKAQEHGVAVPVALILGMFSGVVGGILRDTLLGQIPLVFRRDEHFYATASLVGVGVQLATFPFLHEASQPLGAAFVLATRILSSRFDVRLPAFSEGNED
ncbi:trimeric intracellular cation channel family protein [bacterium]|nr:MAG: trimeric intracellular cation channel family protein [bacterium]